MQERAEREKVGPRVRLASFELFGRHILQRAEDGPFLGDLRPGGERGHSGGGIRRRLGTDRLGQPEVHQLHAGRGEHDVRRLEIAMHDPLPVRLVERVGDLDAAAHRLLERERAALQGFVEGPPLEVLHDEVVGVALASDVVKGADVWMRQLGDGPRLAFEALADGRRRHEARRQNLDRDGAPEAGVAPAVHLAHAAGAERRDDLVGSQA